MWYRLHSWSSCLLSRHLSCVFRSFARTFVILLSGAVPLLFCSVPAAADIYRSVDAKGRVTYSDQPSPGGQRIETRSSAMAHSSDAGEERALSRAQAAAKARIEAELELADRLATDRLERSAERRSRALARAELRESRARERSLAAEQAALEAQRDAFDDRYLPDYAPYYPRYSGGRHGRHHRAPAQYEPFDPHFYDKRYYPYQQPAAPEPTLRSRVPGD